MSPRHNSAGAEADLLIASRSRSVPTLAPVHKIEATPLNTSTV
jgi:hypothetical protein